MNIILIKYKNSALRRFIRKHEKFLPIVFFIGGFVFDTLTLGRVDRLYDLVMLSIHMSLLTLTLVLFNLSDDYKWRFTLIERYKIYFPLAIQFFFGALSSAYVIYFSRSVSLSKTMSFFIILLVLFFANELLKKRISNKYLQFSVYFFISFTFFSFIIPVLLAEMNTKVFIISGIISLTLTLALILIIYKKSLSTRAEMRLGKTIGIVIGMYIIINVFYFFNLIPPVPLALEHGLVAHNIKVENQKYFVSYEKEEWYIFWRTHRIQYISKPNERVYIFSSIFAPTSINKTIFHRWNWYNQQTEAWEIVEDIGYEINGGRDEGYRGYTYKNNTKEGLWKVQVITKEELIIGVVDFEIVINSDINPIHLVEKKF